MVASSSLSLGRYLQFGHVTLAATGKDDILRNFIDLTHRVLVFSETTGVQADADLCFAEFPLAIPAGEWVYAAAGLSVFATETGFYLTCADSHIIIDTKKLKAEAFLATDFWSQSLYAQREFLLLSLLMLMRPKGLYGLHACGLVKGGIGLLLVGSSGSGKTTTSLNLINSGWQFLSDDAVLLREIADDIEALAFRKGFSVLPDGLRHFSHKDISLEFDDPEGKKVINLAPTFGAGFRQSCRPQLIVFPKLGVSGETRLVELSPAKALILLAQQSAGIMTEAGVSARQLQLLSQLLKQARAYEVQLAKDALDEPGLVSDLLGEKL